MRFDASWLLAIKDRIATGAAWESEVRDFLALERPIAADRIRRYQGIAALPAPTSADVDDILQEADLRFVRLGVTGYVGDASPRTYYLRIVAHATSSFYRPRARRLEINATALLNAGDDEPSDPLERAVADDDPLRHERRRVLDLAMRALWERHPDLAEALELWLFENMSAEEAAAKLRISVDAFHKRVSRARQFLVEQLAVLGWRR